MPTNKANTAQAKARAITTLRTPPTRATKLAGREVIRLSPDDQKCFVEVLLSPPEATPALKRAFAWHRHMVKAG